jgi:hypothetical protein
MYFIAKKVLQRPRHKIHEIRTKHRKDLKGDFKDINVNREWIEARQNSP